MALAELSDAPFCAGRQRAMATIGAAGCSTGEEAE